MHRARDRTQSVYDPLNDDPARAVAWTNEVLMFDPNSAQYFLSPSYLPSSGKVRDVIDPGRLEKVGIRAEVTASEADAALDRLSRSQTAPSSRSHLAWDLAP